MHEILRISNRESWVVYFVVDSNKNNVVYHRNLYQPMSFQGKLVGAEGTRGERFGDKRRVRQNLNENIHLRI